MAQPRTDNKMKFRLVFQSGLDVGAWVFAWGSALIVALAFVALVGKTIVLGLQEFDLAFLTELPAKAGLEGGIWPMIVSTFWILMVCLATSVPLGLGAAVYLAEFVREDSLTGRMTQRSLDVLAGVPSILFGLFGNAFFCITLGMGFSILSGGLTLACMVLPILIHLSKEGLQAVPNELRQGAAGLGLSRTTTVFRILLPSAAPALAAGLVLGIGRAIAETAALIFTAGYVSKSPRSLFDSGRSLSVHIYDMAMNVPGGNGRAFATATVLVLMLLAINGVAIGLTKFASSGIRRTGQGRVGL